MGEVDALAPVVARHRCKAQTNQSLGVNKRLGQGQRANDNDLVDDPPDGDALPNLPRSLHSNDVRRDAPECR